MMPRKDARPLTTLQSNPSLVQVWVYAEDVYRFVPSMIWDKYAAVFPRIWSASAFKGAFGETLYIPNAKRHLEVVHACAAQD